MSNEIDWSKAPEGCIGAFVPKEDNANKWFFVSSKNESEYSFMQGFSGKKACGKEYHVYSEYWDWIARPVEWTGTGLPPVGTVCEVNWENRSWERCEIIAHKDLGGLVHAIAWIDVDRIDQSNGSRFRPIRTPEQIAAEEREKAIQQMIKDARPMNRRAVCEDLYDAGYRKTESAK